MKNLFKFLHLFVFAGLIVLINSCGSDDEDPTPNGPTVTTSTDKSAYEVGDTVVVSISFTAEGQLSGINFTPIVDDVEGTKQFNAPDVFGLTSESTDGTFAISFTNLTTEDLVGSTIGVEVEIVDMEGQTATSLVSFTVEAPSSPEARVYSTVLLVVPLGNLTGQNFFASSTGEVYSSDDVTGTSMAISPLIDFGYYYGSTDLASIASPLGFESTIFADQVNGWTTKNATVLKSTSLTAAQFTEISTFAGIDEAFDAGTDEEGIIVGLAVGDVFAFETVEGTRGLVLVTEQVGTFNEGDNIKIDVIVQEDAI
jgi:hypothetical protein